MLVLSLVVWATGFTLLAIAIGASDPVRRWTPSRRERFAQLVQAATNGSSSRDLRTEDLESAVELLTQDLLPAQSPTHRRDQLRVAS